VGVSPSLGVSAHTRKLPARGFNVAVLCRPLSQEILPAGSLTRSIQFTSALPEPVLNAYSSSAGKLEAV
jgi:hypothetical protein